MMTTIISRKGSQVIVRDKLGKLWLTRRKKLRHDSRRRKNTPSCRVIHIPIRRILERGDWIFTCNMHPSQYDKTLVIPDLDRPKYGKMPDDKWQAFQNDHFCTMEGSHHSVQHCSCKPISDAYAKFFNDHKLWELFDKNSHDWDKYEEDVKIICKIFKIQYEGI